MPVRPEVNVRLAQPAGINPTLDEGLWIAIRHTANDSFETIACSSTGSSASRTVTRTRANDGPVEEAGLVRPDAVAL